MAISNLPIAFFSQKLSTKPSPINLTKTQLQWVFRIWNPHDETTTESLEEFRLGLSGAAAARAPSICVREWFLLSQQKTVGFWRPDMETLVSLVGWHPSLSSSHHWEKWSHDDDERSSHHTPNALGHQTGVLLSRMARDLAFWPWFTCVLCSSAWQNNTRTLQSSVLSFS